ncbi:MAG TPA: hypothetical protein VGQ20_16830 [Acidimicrobiales bacterium]|jgi:hypothetical protein|nr:hypothetical protein [Acidimicrobiales bacterium]
MYATLRIYEMSEDWDDVLVRHIEEGFVPRIESLPGFVSYQCVEAGPRVFASVTVFTDRTGAEASDKAAASYVLRHLADRFPSPPEITAGEVRAGRVLDGRVPVG